MIGVVTIADILFHLIYHTTGESRKESEINLLNYMSSESLLENLQSPCRISGHFSSKFVLGNASDISLSSFNEHKPALVGNKVNRHFGDKGVVHSEPVFFHPNSYDISKPKPDSRRQTATVNAHNGATVSTQNDATVNTQNCDKDSSQNGAKANTQNGGNFNSLFGDGNSHRNVNNGDIKDRLECRIDTAIDVASALADDNSGKLENSAETKDSVDLAGKVCRSLDKSSNER